jgi:hypothetical protein
MSTSDRLRGANAHEHAVGVDRRPVDLLELEVIG